MREFVMSSSASQNTGTNAIKKYPWRTLPVGMSFIVKYGECSHKTLQNHASRMGVKLGKRFRVIDHGEAIGYEVAYVENR